jgi:hypothetical protein
VRRRAPTILDAVDDQRLFGPWFRERETWASWLSFLAALFAGKPNDETFDQPRPQSLYRGFADCCRPFHERASPANAAAGILRSDRHHRFAGTDRPLTRAGKYSHPKPQVHALPTAPVIQSAAQSCRSCGAPGPTSRFKAVYHGR